MPVAIIGGGFTGLSTALHLAEQGVQATVLEAQEPGWGASGNNGGQVNPGLKHDPDQIEADFGAELGRRMIEFSYGTTNFTLDLIRRYQIPCEARQNGTLRAAYNEASAAAIETTAEQCIRRGMPVTLAGAATVARDDRHRPLSLRHAGQPRRRSASAELCPRAGARRDRGRRGRARRDAGTVASPRRRALAHRDAARDRACRKGAARDQRLHRRSLARRSAAPSCRCSRSIAATAPLSDEVARAIMPTRPVLYESGHITVYYRIDQRNRLLDGRPRTDALDPARRPTFPISSATPNGCGRS